MASTLKVDNIIATDGTTAPITLSGDAATLGSGVTFPTGHIVQSAVLSMAEATTYTYESTGSEVTATNITLSLNKIHSSSRLIMQYSIGFNLYFGNDYYAQGNTRWFRSAPSNATFGRCKAYRASEDEQTKYLNSYHIMNGGWVDTSTATGTHTYVFKLTEGRAGGAFRTIHGDGDQHHGLCHLMEVM